VAGGICQRAGSYSVDIFISFHSDILAAKTEKGRDMKKSVSAANHVVLGLLVIFSILPITVLVMNSFKSNKELVGYPLRIPKTFYLQNYADVWNIGGYLRAYVNNILIIVITIAVIGVVAGLCGFALGFFTFRGMNFVLSYFLAATSIPAQIFIVPLYIYWQKMNLTDSTAGIIIIYSALYLPVCIFLLRSYFLSIPNEICESARIDGCGNFQIFTRIVSPMSISGYATLVLILSYWIWNEFLFAITFLHRTAIQTVSMRFLRFSESHYTNFAYVSAAGVITVLPIVTICILMQKRFVAGLIQGGIK
jgi:raffinose/stachyose/melibiose transport system permease protein